jgi:spermidine synthase
MGFASDDRRCRLASAAIIAARYRRAGQFPTQYWTPAVHRAAFALPRFIQELVEKAKP